MSDSYSVDPRTIRRHWSFVDVFEAHAALDFVEAGREYWRENPPKAEQ